MRAIAQDLSHYKIVGIIRVGTVLTKHGEPWEYCLTYASNDGESCKLFGFKGDSKFQLAHSRAIGECLNAMGYHGKVEWERRKPKKARVFLTEYRTPAAAKRAP